MGWTPLRPPPLPLPHPSFASLPLGLSDARLRKGFLQGVKLYGRKSFNDIAAIVGTRTHLQVPFMFVIRISKGIDRWDKLFYRVWQGILYVYCVW